jgi:hypothetical protein
MLVESWKTVVEQEQNALAILTEMFDGDEILAEGLLTTVKDKAKAWVKTAAEAGAKALPGLNKKFSQSLEQISDKISPEAAKDLEQQMVKQGGANWKTNVGKVAAGVAVATALLANPAQARTIYIIEPGHPVPVHQHHGNGAQFLGAMVGAAIGAAIAGQQQPHYPPGYGYQQVPPPGYYHPQGAPPGYYVSAPPGYIPVR